MQFYDVNGQRLDMNCANYFGFNNGATMLDGLYGGSTALTKDFGNVLYRIQVQSWHGQCRAAVYWSLQKAYIQQPCLACAATCYEQLCLAFWDIAAELLKAT